MKAPTMSSCAVLLLLLALCSSTLSAPVIPDQRICCPKYAKRELPGNLIQGYFETSSQCSLPLAVVFITKKGQRVCTNPEDAWVQDRLNDLNRN